MPGVDLILHHARLYGADTDYADGLVAVRGGQIAAVAGGDRLAALKGPQTRFIDCRGGTLCPGFHDAHCHLFSLMHHLDGVDLGPASVPAITDAQVALRARASQTPPGEWVSGHGYDDFYLGRHPVRADLDAAVPGHPVMIAHRSLHACVLNSAALGLAGIDAHTSEPPGATIDREPETGLPSGLLYEMLGFVRHQVMPAPGANAVRAGLRRVSDYLVRRGITSVQDAGAGNDTARWDVLRETVDRGDMKCRVTMMAGGLSLKQFTARGITAGAGHDRLRLGAAKFMLHQASGGLYPSQEELDALVAGAQEAGFPVAIHAVTENEVAAAVNAITRVGGGANPASRHRIEHASECPPYLVAGLRAANITAVSQPSFLHYSGARYRATVAAEMLPHLYPFRSWLAAGVPLAAGSDSPVVPADPLTGISAAVTRRDAAGEVLNGAECIDATAALALYTSGAARATGAEQRLGSLTPGKLADLVLLREDPRTVPPETIKDITVDLCVVGGAVVWDNR